MNLIAPLLKFRHCPEGQVIKLSEDAPSISSAEHSKPKKSKGMWHPFNLLCRGGEVGGASIIVDDRVVCVLIGLLTPALPDQAMGILFDGTFASLPPTADLPSLAVQLAAISASSRSHSSAFHPANNRKYEAVGRSSVESLPSNASSSRLSIAAIM